MSEYIYTHFLKLELLASWIAEKQDIWQMDFLDAKELSDFCKHRGLVYWSEHIEQLWQLGLLTADVVISSRKLRQSGLVYIKRDDFGRHIYADGRKPRRSAKGWAEEFKRLKKLDSSIQPLFHPFRFYVIYTLNRRLKLSIVPIQTLHPIDVYKGLLEKVLKAMQKVISTTHFRQQIQEANAIAALAIATEPYFYERIFNSFRWYDDEKVQRENISEHWKNVTHSYQQIGREAVEKARRTLCQAAQILDGNIDIHTLLRLAKGDLRLKLKGNLGGAIYLLTMAEMLRRGAEEIWNVQLPEEDESGFAMWPAGVKNRVYGADRILDSGVQVANEYLRQFRLDYGIRVRWYVEGETEIGALGWVIDALGAHFIELVNLRGRVVQKRILSFRDSLRADINAQIFSLVYIDSDTSENVRAVRKAAEDDEICGAFFIANQDFEFDNFTPAELEGILWEWAIEKNASPNSRKILHRAISSAMSGKEVIEKAKSALVELCAISKGISWGERLMRYAWEHTDWEAELKPMVRAVRMALFARSYSYNLSRKEDRVDPKSGQLVKR